MTESKSLKTAKHIADLAEEKRAENVVVMDMRKVSGLCDFFVLASASSAVRAKTIGQHIQKEMKAAGESLLRVDGMKEGSWVVLDFADIMVHVFHQDTRQYYNIEQLWGDAPRVLRTSVKTEASNED